MGFSLHWYGFRQSEGEAVLRELQLTPTGETDEGPEALATLKLPNGWQVIWDDDYELDDVDLAKLSSGREIIKCFIEEHVMESSSEFWSGGQRKWLIRHNSQRKSGHLEVEGELPANFDEVRRKFEAKEAEGKTVEVTVKTGFGKPKRRQTGVDYIFEIPLEVASGIVGFRHDGLSEEPFHVLTRPRKQPLTSKNRGFFSRLFGKHR